MNFRLKFRHKVFLAFLVNSLIIVVSTLLIGKYFADLNFEKYIRKVERQRVNDLADTLGQEYQRTGNWEKILGDWNHWLKVAALEEPKRAFDPAPPSPGSSDPSRTFFPDIPKPPAKGPLTSLFSRPMAPPPTGPRTCLLDTAFHPLTPCAIRPTPIHHTKAILVDQQTVGWLTISALEHPPHPLDVEFLRRQSMVFYAIAGVALLLAVLVTFVLSKHLTAPLKRLTDGTRALTSRRFETRVAIPVQDEFGRLASHFNAMAQALERHEHMRKQWLSDISHELRTPLSILRGEIEAIQDGIRPADAETLASLHFEVSHLGRIVGDLHELSLMDARMMKMEPVAVNPREILKETVLSFQTRLKAHGIEVEAPDGQPPHPLVWADPVRLRQLFSNLLENTLRYADKPGHLEIHFETQPETLSITFEDTGPGVPEASLEYLFDRLYRVDKARSRSLGGSGLGLSICRGIVEWFGGHINAYKAPIGGLGICIVLPTLKVEGSG